MSSDREAPLDAENERLRARVAELERHLLTSAIERKSDEEALRKSEATSRAFFESAAESIIVIDRAGKIVLVNAQTEQMFGYRRGELIGQTLELLLPENVRATHVRHREAY